MDRSPFIRNLSLINCQGISKLHVFGLVHLKNLTVVLCKLDRVIVQAPNLQFFRYAEGPDHPCEIAILDGYNTLQTLKLIGGTITDQLIRDVSYKFPNISELNFTECHNLKNIEIQSEKLKKFTLSQRKNLEKVTIQAPKLLTYEFEGDKMPFSSTDPSSLERARLSFFLVQLF
uniref:F-box family protein n=1 Tax=Solanum tuberosum TaxID=4113 RepID=M1CIA2_SOLTU